MSAAWKRCRVAAGQATERIPLRAAAGWWWASVATMDVGIACMCGRGAGIVVWHWMQTYENPEMSV
jgi:hypothetical protein